jgi:pimeloyl-ACP methyl ester carboxylesterase
VDVPVHHVHGSRDRLIPLRRVRADRVVEGAGHLLTLTHPDAVSRFLIEIMEAGG